MVLTNRGFPRTLKISDFLVLYPFLSLEKRSPCRCIEKKTLQIIAHYASVEVETLLIV